MSDWKPIVVAIAVIAGSLVYAVFCRLFPSHRSNTTEANGMEEPKKSITFLNSMQHFAALVANDPQIRLPPMRLVHTDEGKLTLFTMAESPNDVKLEPIPGSTRKESVASYTELFHKSHTVVISDSMFSEQSMMVDTEPFLNMGLGPLQDFFEGGGRVVVVCVEGIYAIGDVLSRFFGSKWKLFQVDDYDCVVTERGKKLLGDGVSAPKVYLRKGHFMKTPEDEGIYGIFTPNFETYLVENYGADADEEDRKDAKASWRQLGSISQSSFVIAMHNDTKSQGSLVWFGDRGMKSELHQVFAKLICREM
jgi:hypothetical protein